MSESKNPHDAFFKQLLAQPEAAADFLSNYLPPEVVVMLDLDQFSLQCTGRISTATGRERSLGNYDDRAPYRSRY
jgi:hypothetical protein